jgi:hypothetical protein
MKLKTELHRFSKKMLIDGNWGEGGEEACFVK